MAKRAPEAIYREEGGKWRVRVLSDGFDTKQGLRVVKLRFLEQMRPSPRQGPIPIGRVLEVTVRPGSEHIVGWTLEPITKEKRKP